MAEDGYQISGIPARAGADVVDACAATALPATPGRPAGDDDRDLYDTDVPLSKAKFTVPVWTPGDSAERFAAIEIDVPPGNNCPLAGDTLSQPIPFDVEDIGGIVDRVVGRIGKSDLLLLMRRAIGGTRKDHTTGRESDIGCRTLAAATLSTDTTLWGLLTAFGA